MKPGDIECTVREVRTKAECRILMRVNSLRWKVNKNGPCKGQSALARAQFFRDLSQEFDFFPDPSHESDGGAQ